MVQECRCHEKTCQVVISRKSQNELVSLPRIRKSQEQFKWRNIHLGLEMICRQGDDNYSWRSEDILAVNLCFLSRSCSFSSSSVSFHWSASNAKNMLWTFEPLLWYLLREFVPWSALLSCKGSTSEFGSFNTYLVWNTTALLTSFFLVCNGALSIVTIVMVE